MSQLTPEEFEVSPGGLERGEDAGPAFRAMFAKGLETRRSRYALQEGRIYNFSSPTPGRSAFLIRGTAHIDAWGATLNGLPGLLADRGASIARIAGQGMISWNGGTITLHEATTYTSSGQGVSGFAVEAGVDVRLRDVTIAMAGAGDSGILIGDVTSAIVEGCAISGAPDLGIYISQQGVPGQIIVQNNRFERCDTAINAKRRSADVQIAGNTIVSCPSGILAGGVQSGKYTQPGERLTISRNTLRLCGDRPVDIIDSPDTLVSENVVVDWGYQPDGSRYVGLLPAYRANGARATIVNNRAIMVGAREPEGMGGGPSGLVATSSHAGVQLGVWSEDCVVKDNQFYGIQRGVLIAKSAVRCTEANNKLIPDDPRPT